MKSSVVIVALILLVIIKFLHARDLRRMLPGVSAEEDGQETTILDDSIEEKRQQEGDNVKSHDDIRLDPVRS